jgi:hypothetical protein
MAAIFKPLAFFFLGRSFEFSGLKIGHVATVRTFYLEVFRQEELGPISLAVPSHLLTVESDERQLSPQLGIYLCRVADLVGSIPELNQITIWNQQISVRIQIVSLPLISI